MTDNKELNKCFEIAENLGWNITNSFGKEYIFSQLSPEDQDFNVIVEADNVNDLIQGLEDFCDGFDVSYETYLWLDNTGHGTNGAPYDMKDIYEDMETCLKMVEDLIDELKSVFELREEINMSKNTNKYEVAVTWEMCGYIEVEANNLAEAMDKVRKNPDDYSLPSDAEYVDGSLGLTTEDVEHMKNICQY